MPTEQRVIASKPKIGAKPTIGGAAGPAEPEAPPAKKSKKLVMILVLLLVVGGGAGYWFVLGPGAAGGEEEAVEKKPEPGDVLVVDPISLNLADGHYLRLGMGLQMAKTAGKGHGDPTPAPALDHAIALFSGRPMAEVASPEGREALKAELLHLLEEAYHGDVIDVYFTEYVTQ